MICLLTGRFLSNKNHFLHVCFKCSLSNENIEIYRDKYTHQKAPPCSLQLLKFITLCSAKFSKENNTHLFDDMAAGRLECIMQEQLMYNECCEGCWDLKPDWETFYRAK